MDDLIQILLFVATLVILIVSSVRKQKKKSGNKSFSFENVLESFLGEPVKNRAEPQTEQQQAWSNQQYDEDSVEEPQQPEKPKFEEGVSAITNNKNQSDGAYEIEEKQSEIEFDLREAIIYSEILNRKTYYS